MTRSVLRPVAILLVALAGGLTLRGLARGSPPAPSPAAASGRESVLLVSIDTWRTDAIGVSGSGRVETPVLDRLAKEGVWLRGIQTPGPLTTPSHATLLTGLTPRHHGLRYNLGFRLAPGVVPLAGWFRRGGWRTLAVVSATPLRRSFGFDRGFDVYDDRGLAGSPGRTGEGSEIPAVETTRRALEMLGTEAGKGKPLFLWVHYYAPHAPYEPPEPWRSSYAKDPYAGEVASVDAELGRLLAALPKANAPWRVVVTGDHGEGLGDHGEATHGMTLYREVTEVPLILHPRPPRFREPDGPACLADVAPTLCDLESLGCSGMDGASLLAPLPRRTLSAETAMPLRGYGLRPALLVRDRDRVLVHQGVDELYDLARDPAERSDLAPAPGSRDELRRLARELPRLFGKDPAGELLGGTARESPAEAKALRSLGYLSGHPAADRLEPTDHRRVLVDLKILEEGRSLLAAGRFADAAARLRRFVALHPNGALAWQALGQALAETGEVDEAAGAFERALALDPSDVVSALNLGNVRMKGGRPADAVTAWKRAVALDDELAQVHLNLGAVLIGSAATRSEAERHLRRFLELAPSHPAAADVRRTLGTPPPGTAR